MIIEHDNKIYLGVDWGSKRIGLSLGDGETRVVTPYKTVANAREVAKVVIDDKIDVLVVGAPYSIPERGLRATKEFHTFINELRSLIKQPIDSLFCTVQMAMSNQNNAKRGVYCFYCLCL